MRTARKIFRSPDETTAFARFLAPSLRPGDTLLLDGPVGSGKTHFARALIKALLIDDEDVPSPTFTLVQTYETRSGLLWHADLYRLADISEVEELGLSEAFASAICVIEWPDRLGPLAPETALGLRFEHGQGDEVRHVTLEWTDPRWTALLGAQADV